MELSGIAQFAYIYYFLTFYYYFCNIILVRMRDIYVKVRCKFKNILCEIVCKWLVNYKVSYLQCPQQNPGCQNFYTACLQRCVLMPVRPCGREARLADAGGDEPKHSSLSGSSCEGASKILCYHVTFHEFFPAVNEDALKLWNNNKKWWWTDCSVWTKYISAVFLSIFQLLAY